jgi:transcriptional regulator with XRE-family HTH domain
MAKDLKTTTISASQVRAGRAFVGWSARELSERSEVSLSTIQRLEAGELVTPPNMAAIRRALEAEGIEFAAEDHALGVWYRSAAAGDET